MHNAHLGALAVSRIGLGAMTMAGTYTTEGAVDDAESLRTIHRALDLGVTHIDTAEIYGPFHSEEVVGKALVGRRDKVVIAATWKTRSCRSSDTWVSVSSPTPRWATVCSPVTYAATTTGARRIRASSARTSGATSASSRRSRPSGGR
jgi:diketogulonate reductase-like aldo/keto reductase